MTENTDTTQQGTPGQLLPIIIPAVLVIAIIVLFLMWQDADSGRNSAEEASTAIAEEAEENAVLAGTAVAERDEAVLTRDEALAEATEAVLTRDEALAEATEAVLTRDEAIAEATEAVDQSILSQSLAETAESEGNSAVATAEFAVIVQETSQSVAETQVANAEISQGTAVAAFDFQETAIAIASTSIVERNTAVAEQEEASAAQALAQTEADEMQVRLDQIERLMLLNAARLGVILNQLATAEAQLANSGAPLPPPPTPTAGPTGTPGGPTPTPAPSGGNAIFTSNDESYSFQYPDTWFLVADIGDDTVVANTVDASVEITESELPSAGNFWMYVAVFDLGSVGDLGNFLTAAVSELRPDSTLSDVTTFALDDDETGEPIPVAYLDLVGENNRLLIVDLGGGYFGFFDITANQDELDDFMDEIYVVAGTLRYNP